MRKTLIIGLLWIVSFPLSAQIVNTEIEYWAIANLEESPEWKPWKEVEGEILIDLDSDKIIINAVFKNVYFIIELIDTDENEERTKYIMTAVDNNKTKCIIKIVKFDEYRYHLYIEYSNINIIFQIVKI